MTKELEPTYVMDVNGCKATIQRAAKLEDKGEPHGLPAGTPIAVYPIERLPAAPKDWIREAGSYIVPVDPNWGLWFDWQANDALNTAIMPSVKGMNPITGLALDGIRLETYEHKCPKHDKPFLNNRFCEECGYSWTKQNYISAPNTLWWDGFRQEDGKVRQFFFTEDEKKDIASLVIGKQNTVPAFGFAFYKTKVHRTPPPVIQNFPNYHIHHYNWYEKKDPYYYQDYNGYNYPQVLYGSSSLGETLCSTSTPEQKLEAINTASFSTNENAEPLRTRSILRSAINEGHQFLNSVAPKNLEKAIVGVGAGAEIRQNLVPDDLGIDGWQESPAAVIRLYFCFTEQFEKMKSKGIKTFKKTKGFLEGLPVG